MAKIKKIPKKEFTLESVFDSLYLIIFAVLLFFVGYIIVNFNSYTSADHIRTAYYFIPAFAFSIVGILTVKSTRSLLYALSALIVAFLLTIFFFQAIWPLF